MLDKLAPFQVRLFSAAVQVDQAYRLDPQQPDNLCGPYWGALLLRVQGLSEMSADYLAALAGSVLPVGDPASWVPPGASSLQNYRLPLPEAARPEQGGTAVPGLVAAVAQASEGRYSLVPLRAAWSAGWLESLVALCQANPDWQAVPLCNIRTGPLWGSHPPLSQVIAYLSGEAVAAPPADWDVGHFVSLAGVVEGPSRSLLLVRDTYPVLGWDGYHLQPASALASALVREDGNEGGVLLFVASKLKAAVAQQAQALGFEIAVWDNGTPWAETSVSKT